MKTWDPVPWLREMQAALDPKDDVRPGMAADAIEALQTRIVGLESMLSDAQAEIERLRAKHPHQ